MNLRVPIHFCQQGGFDFVRNTTTAKSTPDSTRNSDDTNWLLALSYCCYCCSLLYITLLTSPHAAYAHLPIGTLTCASSSSFLLSNALATLPTNGRIGSAGESQSVSCSTVSASNKFIVNTACHFIPGHDLIISNDEASTLVTTLL